MFFQIFFLISISLSLSFSVSVFLSISFHFSPSQRLSISLSFHFFFFLSPPKSSDLEFIKSIFMSPLSLFHSFFILFAFLFRSLSLSLGLPLWFSRNTLSLSRCLFNRFHFFIISSFSFSLDSPTLSLLPFSHFYSPSPGLIPVFASLSSSFL
ncbi:ETV3 [Acanthosepion pharaonis]|uniref:ETV3 n=1 Tax=Acanthosepion pharaonis TaxID=158019 RepID=A0A812EFD7_ACAPH|nr:ETV3 [Sepia pharaonis]